MHDSIKLIVLKLILIRRFKLFFVYFLFGVYSHMLCTIDIWPYWLIWYMLDPTKLYLYECYNLNAIIILTCLSDISYTCHKGCTTQ